MHNTFTMNLSVVHGTSSLYPSVASETHSRIQFMAADKLPVRKYRMCDIDAP